MNEHEILDMLSENECKLFYAYCANPENESIKAAHAAAKEALESYARQIGII